MSLILLYLVAGIHRMVAHPALRMKPFPGGLADRAGAQAHQTEAGAQEETSILSVIPVEVVLIDALEADFPGGSNANIVLNHE
jgi:hypothetical protein